MESIVRVRRLQAITDVLLIFPMDAERLILETDAAGNLKQVPKLPPNKQLEVIVLVIADVDGLSSSLPQGSVTSLEVANESGVDSRYSSTEDFSKSLVNVQRRDRLVDNDEGYSSRMAVVQKIDDLRFRLQSIYGEFSDATQMLRDDRER
jgi:hypothetical protein